MVNGFDDMMMRKKAQRVHTYMNHKLPGQAKEIGVSFFKSRFRAQGWLDTSFQPWPKRKKTDKRRPGRNILMDRGKLRNSIRGAVGGGKITFGSDVAYAKVHNEGGIISHAGGERKLSFKKYARGKNRGRTLFARNNRAASFSKKVSVKSYAIKMPKRQFMGESAHLNKVITRKITSEILKIFK